MNRKIFYAVLVSSLLLLNISVQNALAQSAFYGMGKNTSSAVVRGAWQSIGRDCTRADDLLQIVGDSVDRVARDIRSGRKFRGRSAVQFGNGYIAGLTKSLEHVINKCTRECQMIGKASGGWSADIYCAVSEIINSPAQFAGMKDVPNLVCGEPYRISCETTFVGTTRQKCRQYARGPNWENYYPASKGGCCAFNPK